MQNKVTTLMLGSEYNWLINLTYTSDGAPQIRRAGSGIVTLLIAVFCFFCIALHAESTSEGVALNVRDFGAVGDGRVHSVKEWVKSGRYASMHELRRACPFAQTDDWSVDEAAFELAKTKLPPSGGTIYFPAGRYIAAHGSWTIKKDHVRLLGDGAEQSVLLTAAKINDALVLSGYRHVGWVEQAAQQFPFAAESGQRGEAGVKLLDPASATEFKPGELVFIRNGACRFDQDYGEFNEVAGVDETGLLRFKHPLSRDYTLEKVNWAGTVARDFALPKPQRTVSVVTSAEPGNLQPNVGATVTVGAQLFEVVGAGKTSLQLRNAGRGNSAAGTVIPAGSPIAKSRAVIRLTQSTRDFRAEKLQFVGHRKILNLSNSYEMEFIDCRFVRNPADADDAKNGVTIDGDGGRWAKFTHCSLQADPPWGMQFARSFGGVIFEQCTFENANVAFTEFSFGSTVRDCSFDFHGPFPEAVVIVGKSGGDFLIAGNRFKTSGAKYIFDSFLDIQSQKHGGEGSFAIRDNHIEASSSTAVFHLNATIPVNREANSVVSH